MSFLPFIKEFDSLEKLEIRSQIQNVVLNAYRKKTTSKIHGYMPYLQSQENRSQFEFIQDIQTDPLKNQTSVQKMYRPYQESTLQSTVGPSHWSMSDNVDNTSRMAVIEQASDYV